MRPALRVPSRDFLPEISVLREFHLLNTRPRLSQRPEVPRSEDLQTGGRRSSLACAGLMERKTFTHGLVS